MLCPASWVAQPRGAGQPRSYQRSLLMSLLLGAVDEMWDGCATLDACGLEAVTLGRYTRFVTLGRYSWTLH